MIWKLYNSNGTLENIITASNKDYVKKLCAKKGWTYELIGIDSTPSSKEPDKNALIDQQIQSISDRQDFIEDCIAEMAMELYKEE